MGSKDGRSVIEVEELETQVWHLHLGGKSQTVIADTVGISQPHVSRIVNKKRKAIGERDRSTLVTGVAARYDALREVHWPTAVTGDYRAGAMVMALDKELRTLLGLDAAVKVEHSGKVATYEIVGVDPDDLS